MRKRTALATTAVVGAATLAGGVFAATLSNISATGYGAGQATQEATCQNPETSTIKVSPEVLFIDGEYRTYEALVSVADAINPMSCDGVSMTVMAFDANGDVIDGTEALVQQDAVDSAQMWVGLSGTVGTDIAGFAVNLNGDPVINTQPFVRYGLGSVVHWSKVPAATEYQILNGATILDTVDATVREIDVNTLGLANGFYTLTVVGVLADDSLTAPTDGIGVSVTGGVARLM